MISVNVCPKVFFSLLVTSPWTGSWLKTLPVDLKVAYINSGHFKTYKTTFKFLKSVKNGGDRYIVSSRGSKMEMTPPPKKGRG